jgi:hypothetical protein
MRVGGAICAAADAGGAGAGMSGRSGAREWELAVADRSGAEHE